MLGPVLFIIYTNDTQRASTHYKHGQYADDASDNATRKHSSIKFDTFT